VFSLMRSLVRPEVVRLAGGLASSALFSNCAMAHMGTGLPGGFSSGFAHPFHGIDHLLAMISVGLWGAFLGRPLLYVLPVVFPAMMAIGAIMGMFAMPVPPVEIGIACSVLVLGTCIAFAIRAPTGVATFVVALFAIFHGYAHGRELPSAADPVSYSAGFVMATGLLHLSGIGLGLLNQFPAGVIATRCIGAAIAVLGVGFIYRAFGA
jgi:urease accessory protein